MPSRARSCPKPTVRNFKVVEHHGPGLDARNRAMAPPRRASCRCRRDAGAHARRPTPYRRSRRESRGCAGHREVYGRKRILHGRDASADGHRLGSGAHCQPRALGLSRRLSLRRGDVAGDAGGGRCGPRALRLMGGVRTQASPRVAASGTATRRIARQPGRSSPRCSKRRPRPGGKSRGTHSHPTTPRRWNGDSNFTSRWPPWRSGP